MPMDVPDSAVGAVVELGCASGVGACENIEGIRGANEVYNVSDFDRAGNKSCSASFLLLIIKEICDR
jgi:hypothetical protein